MIKPIDISSEEFNGLDRDISKNLRKNPTQIPQDNLMYKTVLGDYNLRFSNYQNINETIESDLEIADD